MYSVRYGRDRYHQHLEMIDWCRDNIGPGGWNQGRELAGTDATTWKWFISCVFGNVEFDFVNILDANNFEEFWDAKCN
jgi:hypothetical protein